MKRTAAQLIATCKIFSTLDDAELHALAEYGEFVAVPVGEPVFREGEEAERFHIIADGAVLIQRREDEQRTRDVAQFIAGESFGEMDVLRSSRRAVAAIAVADTRLLVIPAAPVTFAQILENDPIRFAGVLQKLLAFVAGRIRRTNQLLGKNNAWIEEIRRQIYTDKLTGLYNTAYLKDAYATFPPAGQVASVLAFKPDRFKEINDTYGHEVGDRAIQLLARLFRDTISPIGSALRYRGNELLALLPGIDGDAAARVAASLITGVAAIDLSNRTGGIAVPLTVSIGIATAVVDGESDGPALVEHAYTRMMAARNDGGGRVYHASSEGADR